MKNTDYLLITALLFGICMPIQGQVCGPTTQVIDLSTGIDKNGQKIPILSPDDDWKIQLPGSSSYQQVLCGTGNPNGGSYGNTFSGIFNGVTNWGSGLNSDVRWLSPTLNPNGDHLYEPYNNWSITCPPANPNCGTYLYKMSFDLSMCNAQSATIQFDFIGADNKIDQISINSWNSPVNYVYTPVNSSPPNNVFTANPPPITIPVSQLNQGGLNYIIVRVVNQDQYTGLIINGRLTIQSNGFVNFNFKDKNGSIKDQFCLEEDVFLDVTGTRTSNYGLELYYDNGAGFNQVASITVPAIDPYWSNVTKLFENAGVLFSSGAYQVKLILAGMPGSCGPLSITKKFNYICCGPPDASFDVTTSGGQFVTNTTGKGTSEWKLYYTRNVHSGPYSYIATFNTPRFSYGTLTEEEVCYYIVHKITNECGESCASQAICSVAPITVDCNLSKPTGLTFNSLNSQLVWNPVPGASSYYIEIIKNRCCEPNSIITLGLTTAVSQNPSYILGASLEKCYLVRVYAICPDGSRSRAADLCITRPVDDPMGITTGITNVSDPDNMTVVLFPNPASGTINLDISTSYETELNMSIYDETGRLVKTFGPVKANEKSANMTLNIESLSSGIYMVKIQTSDNKVINRELIVY